MLNLEVRILTGEGRKEWIAFQKRSGSRKGMSSKSGRAGRVDPRSTRSSMRRIQVDDAHT